jgi:hypothetical protein
MILAPAGRPWRIVAAIPSRAEIVDGHSRHVWTNAAGEDVLEHYMISGMGHGTPVALNSGPERQGVADRFFLDAGIPSSYHIVSFWGLATVELGASALARIDAEPVLPLEVSADRIKRLGRLRAFAARALGALGLQIEPRGDRVRRRTFIAGLLAALCRSPKG